MLETDTSRVPDSGPTVASRTTLMSGNAVLNACEPLRRRIFETAQEMLKKKGGAETPMSASDGKFSVAAAEVGFAEVARECYLRKLKMAEQGWYSAPPTSFDTETGQGDAYVTYAYSANVAEVEVDAETGETKVTKVTSAHDIGKVINPNAAEGQIEGGIVQALGYAFIEEIIEREGQVVNPNFTDYILPASADAPEFKTILLEHPYPAGPYGAKGLAESPIIGPAPAALNALRHACGVRLSHIPAMPEAIWKAVKHGDQKKQ